MGKKTYMFQTRVGFEICNYDIIEFINVIFSSGQGMVKARLIQEQGVM